MSSLDDEILKVLKALDQQGALKHLVVIGSWATLFYQDHFKDPNYHPVIRTTDIDFLVPKKPLLDLNIDLSKTLKDLGFLEEFSHDGWVTFEKPDFHVEFLYPRVGQQSDEPKSIPELGINARPLRFMSLMARETIQCSFHGIKMILPHPAVYGIHKLIISTRRTKDFKRDNDRQQAEMVLTSLSNSKDIVLLEEIYGNLSKKEKKVVLDAMEGRPFLQEIFKDGQALKAQPLNQLYERIADAYKRRGFEIRKKIVWKDGKTLHARELNILLDTVNELYEYMKIDPPQWSFGRFQNGAVLKASQLNEIDRRLKALPVRKDAKSTEF